MFSARVPLHTREWIEEKAASLDMSRGDLLELMVDRCKRDEDDDDDDVLGRI